MPTDTLDPTASSLLPDMSTIEDISLDSDLVDESQPFLGVIVLDEYQPNYNKDGYQWVMGVRPLDFVVKGELACFFSRCGISTNPSSKMGMTLKAFQLVFGKEKKPIGRGHLRGRVGIFVNRNVSFGLAPDGSERKARVTLPVRKADESEEARASGIAQAILSGQPMPEAAASTDAAGAPPTNIAYDDEQIAAILAVIEGKTPSEFQMAALTSGLAPDLMNAVLSGTALAALKASGAVTIGEDGRVATAAAKSEESLV